MPNKDGVELIRELRGISRTLPIIAISAGGRGMTAEDTLELALALGADAGLLKPLREQELVLLVRRLLLTDSS